MSVTWFGDRAVQVLLDDPSNRHAVVSAYRTALPTCTVRAGMDAVLIEAGEPDLGLLAAVAAVDVAEAAGSLSVSRRSVEIAVCYDGADLDDLARVMGTSATGLVGAHHTQRWEVAMMGFAPGFGYLVPHGQPTLDWSAIQRRSSPRTSVPAGSVAVAAGMSAVYPHALPGGWQLIGTTTMRMFDATAVGDPSALRSGDLVRFTAVR